MISIYRGLSNTANGSRARFNPTFWSSVGRKMNRAMNDRYTDWGWFSCQKYDASALLVIFVSNIANVHTRFPKFRNKIHFSLEILSIAPFTIINIIREFFIIIGDVNCNALFSVIIHQAIVQLFKRYQNQRKTLKKKKTDFSGNQTNLTQHHSHFFVFFLAFLLFFTHFEGFHI